MFFSHTLLFVSKPFSGLSCIFIIIFFFYLKQVKLTVQGEVVGRAVLQQVFIVEYTVANQMCDDCHRTEAKDYWKALVC